MQRHLVEVLKDTIIRVAIKGSLEQFLDFGCTLELPEEIKKYLCPAAPQINEIRISWRWDPVSQLFQCSPVDSNGQNEAITIVP